MPSYQLAISNIAWQKDDDETVYAAMQQAGFTGLELAPTRIFSEAPYENLTSALLFGGYLKNRWGFSVPSLQSIWYGQKGNIFDPADTEHLLDYAARKLKDKNLDLIVANDVANPSIGFNSEENACSVIDRELHATLFAQTSKGKIARQLISFIAQRLNQV